MRRLNDPHPLPVAWHPADLDVVQPWQDLRDTARGWPGGPPTDPAGWAATPADLAGTGNDLADRLARVPTGRLVVLGDPGAGKTILLVRLILELLARRHPGGPVPVPAPVLVPLAGWNPAARDLPGWLAARLTVDHPGLAESAPPEAGAGSRARALWDQRLLLPILDGLDELPAAVWGQAVTGLNDALPPRQGLAVASGSAAYRQAAAPADSAAELPVRLWGAAGIILRPVADDQVRAYLQRAAASPTAAARWDPVLATLGTSAPAAQALRTPLLVSLARTIYNPRPGKHTGVLPDPDELCDTRRFPTPAAIQAHLFDGFIPAAYRPHPDPARRCAWTAKQAERWLVFLARHLEHDRAGTTDLAWWELYRAVPRPVVALVVGLAVGVGVGLAVGLAGALTIGIMTGLTGTPANLTVAAEPRVGLARDRSTFRTIVLVGGFVIGLPRGHVFDLTAGLAGVPLGALAAAVAYAPFQTAWGWFVVARCWLALRRRLPWRLMSFLVDAHQQRGVLRQAGMVYQFRHADLQHRLATRPATINSEARREY